MTDRRAAPQPGRLTGLLRQAGPARPLAGGRSLRGRHSGWRIRTARLSRSARGASLRALRAPGEPYRIRHPPATVRPESRSEPVTIRSGPANVWFLGIRARARHVLVGDWLLVSRPDPVSTARSMAAITETLPPGA